MTRTAAILLLGAALSLGWTAPAFAATTNRTAEAASVVFGATHAEAALSEALGMYIPHSRIKIELDNASIELVAPADAGRLTAERVYYNGSNGRFAAELVIPGAKPAIRVPVAGRAFGVVDVPVLTRRLSPNDQITAADVGSIEMRVDYVDRDSASNPEDLIGYYVRRAVPVNQPVRLRDVQTPRLVDKGAIVTIVLATPKISLTAQGRAQQEGGKGDVIRVVNTQSNRVVEATIIGFNQVAVAKPGVPAF